MALVIVCDCTSVLVNFLVIKGNIKCDGISACVYKFEISVRLYLPILID